MTMKNFFMVTAAFELLTGMALLTMPAFTTFFLLGASTDTPVATVVVRVAGAALITIAIACWSARYDPGSRTKSGLLVAMLFYNALVILVLAYSAVTSSLMGAGFFPAVVAHVVLGIWTVACLLRAKPEVPVK